VIDARVCWKSMYICVNSLILYNDVQLVYSIYSLVLVKNLYYSQHPSGVWEACR